VEFIKIKRVQKVNPKQKYLQDDRKAQRNSSCIEQQVKFFILLSLSLSLSASQHQNPLVLARFRL